MSCYKVQTPGRSVEFGITNIPYRKHKCLYLMRGAMLEPVAYFRNDEDAARFESVMDMMIETVQELYSSANAELHSSECSEAERR